MNEAFVISVLCFLGVLLIWGAWEAVDRRRKRQQQEAQEKRGRRATIESEKDTAPTAHAKTAHILRVHSLYSGKCTGLFTTPYANNKSQHSFQHGWSSGCVMVTSKKGNVTVTDQPLKGTSKPKRCAKLSPASFFPSLSSSPKSLKPLTPTYSSGHPLTSPGAKRKKSVTVPAPSPKLGRKEPPKKRSLPGKGLPSPPLPKKLPSNPKALGKLPPSPHMSRGPNLASIKPLKGLKQSPGLPRKLLKDPLFQKNPLLKLPKKA